MSLLCTAALGCPRYTTEKTYSLEAGKVQRISIDAPTYEQTVKVQVSSPGVPVSVYLVTEDYTAAVEQSLLAYKEPDKGQLLASKERLEEGTLEAKVPRKKGYAVLIAGAAKDAAVKVKISGS